MAKTKIRILGIAPYEDMYSAMERAAQAYPDIQLDVYIGDLEDGVAIVQRMPQNTYDCIISRGGTATLIRQETDLPVVEIQLSVYDVLSTMKLAENYSSRYAIVGFPNITEPAHILCDLLGYDLDIVTVYSGEEAAHMLEQLKEDGYRMVVCDVITHTVARQMGLDAFLITSGMESLHAAIDQAIHISIWFERLRQENTFLHSIIRNQNGREIVLETDGTLFYSDPSDPPVALIQELRSHLKEVPEGGSLKFYHTEHDQLYRITGQVVLMDGERYVLFYCIPSRIPLHSSWGKAIRAMNKGECEYLFTNSFYSISGAMGNLDGEIRMLASVNQPVMIRGESGTGKEQIARFLYLKGPLANKPFVMVNCRLMTDKSWDFLLDSNNSPLNADRNTIYFENLEALSEMRAIQLADVIQETGLARRLRLIFSYVCGDEEDVPQSVRRVSTRLGCLLLHLPSLRSRTDEIPSLASLYLGSLKQELGKQLSGFEPKAVERLCQYHWPNNYTQFKHVLKTLAAASTSTYIRSDAVAELLAKERQLHRNVTAAADRPEFEGTLEDMITQAVRRTVAAHKGNKTAAARQLGISRTTLWRYLSREEEG